MSNVLGGEALSTVRAIVGGVDYKGCRDLMKLLFDRFHRVPHSLPSSQLPALRRGRDLLAYILDRNAALLPAYFAYDEICRHYPDKTCPPHWLLPDDILVPAGLHTAPGRGTLPRDCPAQLPGRCAQHAGHESAEHPSSQHPLSACRQY